MEPAGDGVVINYGMGVPSEQHKSGLEGILSVVVIPKNSVTNSVDHIPIKLQESRKGLLISALHERSEQLRRRQALADWGSFIRADSLNLHVSIAFVVLFERLHGLMSLLRKIDP